MLPVRLTLVRDAGQAPTESETIAFQDAVWAHAAPEFGLEHVRAVAVPGGIDLMVFVRARNVLAAQTKAQRLLSDVLSSRSASARGYFLALHR